MKERLLEDLGS